MTVLLAIAAALSAPIEGEDSPQETGPSEVEAKRSIKIPPLFIEHRGWVRPGTTGSLNTEVGVKVLRTRRAAVETYLAAAPSTRLAFRTKRCCHTLTWVNAGAVALWKPSPFLELGPVLDVEYRWYRHFASFADHTLSPAAGLKIISNVVRGRWYALGLTMKGMVDLLPTRLVLEDGDEQALSPLVLQLGIRFAVGNGHSGKRK